jgi:hypothetical protein
MLTNTQLETLKADILADPAFSSVPMTADGDFEIAQAYNLLSAPAFTVWRTNVFAPEIKGAVVWTEYIGLGAAEKSTFELMISDGILDGSDVNIRQGIQDIFSGAQAAATRAALTELAKRVATRAEALFSTGTGTSGSPGTMAVEGALSYFDIGSARSLP